VQDTTPPTLPTDTYAWTLAALPLAYFAAIALAVAALDPDASDVAGSIFAWGVLLFSLVLVSLDQIQLKKSGHWVTWGWVLLTPVAYLIARQVGIKGSSPAPMLLGIATYGIAFTLSLAVILTS
jgi:hypothetical protein